MAGKKKSDIFAAVGAATGLGNAFRFPALCVSYGAVFILAYAAALALVCFPLLCAELDLGRRIGLGGGGKRARIWSGVMRAAAANSALIGLYYGVICQKLGSASLSFAISGDLSAGGNADVAVSVAVLLTVAVFALLNKGKRALSVTGKASVFLSLAMFLCLAVAGAARGNGFLSFEVGKLAGGAIWVDALGQALLALSLAAGVMPDYARGRGADFSPVKTALAVTAFNFIGCVLATFATLPFVAVFPRTVGINCALEVYPQVIFAVAGGGFVARILGFFLFAVLALVGVQSLCSLALPAVDRVAPLFKRGRPSAALLFCAAALISAPVFLYDGLQPLAALDRMACSVNAVFIALAECAFCASLRHIRGVTGFFMRFLCLPACCFLAVVSLCSARFGCFAPLSLFCACAGAFFVLSAPFLPLFIRTVKRIFAKSRNLSPSRRRF